MHGAAGNPAYFEALYTVRVFQRYRPQVVAFPVKVLEVPTDVVLECELVDKDFVRRVRRKLSDERKTDIDVENGENIENHLIEEKVNVLALAKSF